MEELNQAEIDDVSGAGVIGVLFGVTKVMLKSLYVESRYFESRGRAGDFNAALIGGNLGA